MVGCNLVFAGDAHFPFGVTMRAIVALLAAALGLLAAIGRSGAANPDKVGTGTKEQILKRFNEEFVLLTPGKGVFPASFLMGSGKKGPAREQPAHTVAFK